MIDIELDTFSFSLRGFAQYVLIRKQVSNR